MTIEELPSEYWDQYHDETDPAQSEAALNAIAEHYINLVEAVARKLQRRLPDFLDDGELISMGNGGLLKAIHRYNPQQGPFKNYASGIIWGAIMDGLRQADFAPRGLRAQQRKLEEAIQQLQSEGIPSPTSEEVALRLDLDTEDVQEIQRRIVRAEVAPSDPSLLPAVRTATGTEDLFSREMCREFVVWLKTYSQTTQKVIALKYWGNLSMKAIAEKLDIPLEQVRVSHQEVLAAILPFAQDMARDD